MLTVILDRGRGASIKSDAIHSFLTMVYILHTPERATCLAEEQKTAAVVCMKFMLVASAITPMQDLKLSPKFGLAWMYGSSVIEVCRHYHTNLQLSPFFPRGSSLRSDRFPDRNNG